MTRVLLHNCDVFAFVVPFFLSCFTFTRCLPLCPVLHGPSEGYFIERPLAQWDGCGWGPPQCAGGQVQQCDDALRDAAAVAIHLPQLAAALAVSTAPADTTRSTLQPRVTFFPEVPVIKVPETDIPQLNFSRTTPQHPAWQLLLCKGGPTSH